MNTLFRMTDVVKHFRTGRGIVHAVDGVSLDIATGEVLGLVGESGCGKSTLARLAVRILTPDSGTLELDGADITTLGRKDLRPHRTKMQMIFQDPFASLNPRTTVARIIEEPLIVHRRGTADERRERVRWLMSKVGLSIDDGSRLPHEFSGGQRQRIGIARALALSPKLIVCDEPVSALDVSIRAQVINLLASLRAEFDIGYLFISHDLSVVEHVADRIAVMYLGKIVELANRRTLWRKPLHPYTQALMAAIPEPTAGGKRKALPMHNVDPPSPVAPPSACRFHTRCPSRAGDLPRRRAARLSRSKAPRVSSPAISSIYKAKASARFASAPAQRSVRKPDRREIAERSVKRRRMVVDLFVEQRQLLQLKKRKYREVARRDLLDFMEFLHALFRIVFDLHRFETLVHLRAVVSGRIRERDAFYIILRPVNRELGIRIGADIGREKTEIVIGVKPARRGRVILSPQFDLDADAGQLLLENFTKPQIFRSQRRNFVDELQPDAVCILLVARLFEQGLQLSSDRRGICRPRSYSIGFSRR